MRKLIRFLDDFKILGRRVGKPAAIRDDQGRGRELVNRIFRLWLDGYNAGLDMPPQRLVTQLSASNMSDSRALFDGAFCGVASLYLSERADEQAIQQLIDKYPEQAGSVGLGIGAALSHLGVDAVLGANLVRQHTGWMCVESYGFHEGYFHWPRTIFQAHIPAGVSAAALEAFDQGLGRALWFIGEAHPALVAEFTSRFDKNRLPDLWQGIGLMVGYWGCYDATDLKRFLRYAGPNRESLQLGVALATLLRNDTNEIVDHTEGACNIICAASSQAVADMLRSSLNSLSGQNLGKDIVDRWHFIIRHTFVRG